MLNSKFNVHAINDIYFACLLLTKQQSLNVENEVVK